MYKMQSPTNTRWIAKLTYGTKDGPFEREYPIDEVFELHDLVERGPNFHTLISAEVRLADP